MAKGQLSAGSLGGRFLRRTNPHKGQSVPSRISEHEAMATQAKQALPESNRLVRTSAAMLGLAVSVGACGLSLTHNGEQAVAAEPSSTDSATASSASAPFETAAVLAPSESPSESVETATQVIRHTVQEGQTLWEVARFYGLDASALAASNKLAPDAVLRVGQVLLIPVDSRVAQAIESSAVSMMPGYYGPVSKVLTAPEKVATLPNQDDAPLKAKQDVAVETLKQKRDSLRSSLSQLNSSVAKSTSSPSESAEVRLDQQIASIAVPSSVDQTNAASRLAADPASDSGKQIAMRSTTPSTFSVSSPASVGAVLHQVVPGDTLSTIARANGVSVQQLMQANRISDPNVIFVGQTLTIPGQHSADLAKGRFAGEIAAVPSKSLTDVPGPSVLPRPTVAPMSETVGTKMAAVTTFTAPSPSVGTVDTTSDLLQYNQIENLKMEIDRLREKYQAEAAGSQAQDLKKTKVVSTVAAVSSPKVEVADPVNPEFNPDRYSARMQSIRDRIRPSDRVQPPSSNAARVQPTQVIASAPLGSESYDSVTSRLGQTVSPDLPSLGNGSEFLPSVPGQANGYIWPTKGILTSGFGWRWGRMHKGIDIAGPIGTPVVAAAEGRVTYAGWNSGGYGYLVEIQHADGSLTLYAHNSRILVQVGQEVSQGQQISEMGSTGYSTGPHLHFEVHPSGRGAMNPMAFLPSR